MAAECSRNLQKSVASQQLPASVNSETVSSADDAQPPGVSWLSVAANDL
jgi:hypothetical protein